MVVYSYECEKCSHPFTKLYSKDDSEPFHCPSCGSIEVNTKPDQSLWDYLSSRLGNNSPS